MHVRMQAFETLSDEAKREAYDRRRGGRRRAFFQEASTFDICQYWPVPYLVSRSVTCMPQMGSVRTLAVW